MGCIVLATTFLSGCTLVDEELTDCIEEPEKPAQELYITLTVVTPDEAYTRATTNEQGNSSEGEIAGTQVESELNSATIYLVSCTNTKEEKETEEEETEEEETAEAETDEGDNDDADKVEDDYKIALELNVTRERITREDDGSKTLVAKINDINDLIKLAGKTYKILVVGNANATETNLNHNFKYQGTGTFTDNAKDAIFSISSLEEDLTVGKPIGKFGESGKIMPFVNSDDEVTITIPNSTSEDPKEIIKAIQENFESNGKGESIWEINKNKAINLERAVARLEYKDASGSNNTYQISNTDGVKIQLYYLQPFNINTSSYLFRHTAMGTVSDGKSYASKEAEIFGVEKGLGSDYNWVAGSDWTFKDGAHEKGNNYLNSLSLKSETNEENWFYPYQVGNGSTDGIVYVEDIKNVKNGPNSDDGYHPFYYVTENVLPSTSLMQEESDTEGELSLLEQNATGVAFTFVVLGKDNKPLKYSTKPEQDYPNGITNVDGASEDKKIKITDNNGGWIELTPVPISDDKLINDNSSSDDEEEGKGENEEDPAAVDEGETEDKNSDEGNYYYLLTYVGCIAHNNDTEHYTDSAIAPMKYGVVRNNTYQLSISSVNDLPIPNTPENQYFSLEIRVLAWAKRDIHVVW
ncbi:MAG: fimbria major subunit [Muribaculaceae bacterium]|nr:fimbria major subunit [Muribaculaceae bacterium]